MVQAEELVVAFKAEGAERAQAQMEDVEDQLEDTTDEMGDSADQMQEFSTKFRGAMSALVAGFAVAAGGLLSQVPILQEVFAGFGAIITSLGLKLDDTLRPALSGVVDELFDISEEMQGDDGILEAFDTLVTRLGQIGAESIAVAIEGDVLGAGANEIVEFVFPAIGQGTILDQLFSFDLSAAAILTVIFGGLAMTASKILGYIGVSIAASTILSFVFTTIAAGAILSYIFGDVTITEGAILTTILGGITMTVGAILGAIFGGISMTAALIVGAIFGGLGMTAALVLEEVFNNVDMNEAKILGAIFAGLAITAAGVVAAVFGGITMTAALIIGVIFAGVTVTGAAIIDAIDWPSLTTEDVLGALTSDIGGGRNGGGFNFPTPPIVTAGLQSGGVVTGPTPAMVGEGRESEAVLPLSRLDSMLQQSGGSTMINIDGRRLNERTGRFGRDQTARRGVDGG